MVVEVVVLVVTVVIVVMMVIVVMIWFRLFNVFSRRGYDSDTLLQPKITQPCPREIRRDVGTVNNSNMVSQPTRTQVSLRLDLILSVTYGVYSLPVI